MSQVFDQPDSDPRQFNKQEPAARKDEHAQQDDKQEKVSDSNKADSNKDHLTKEDLPDSTNESKGTMGSGQRQDSN